MPKITLREYLTGDEIGTESTTLLPRVTAKLAKEIPEGKEPSKEEQTRIAVSFLENLLKRNIAEDIIKTSKRKNFFKCIADIAHEIYAVRARYPSYSEDQLFHALGNSLNQIKPNLEGFFSADDQVSPRKIQIKQAATEAALRIDIKAPAESKEQLTINEVLTFLKNTKELFIVWETLLSSTGIKDQELNADNLKKITDFLTRPRHGHGQLDTDDIVTHLNNLKALSASLKSNKDKPWPDEPIVPTLEVFGMKDDGIEALCTLAYGAPYIAYPPTLTTLQDEDTVWERGQEISKNAQQLAEKFKEREVKIDGTRHFVNEDKSGGMLYGRKVAELRKATLLDEYKRYPEQDRSEVMAYIRAHKKPDGTVTYAWGEKDHFHWTFKLHDVDLPIAILTDRFNKIKNAYTLSAVVESLKTIGVTLDIRNHPDDKLIANRILLENHLRKFYTAVQESKILSRPQQESALKYLDKEWESIIEKNHKKDFVISQFEKLNPASITSFSDALKSIGGGVFPTMASQLFTTTVKKRGPASPPKRLEQPGSIKKRVRDFFKEQQKVMPDNQRSILSNLRANLDKGKRKTMSEFFIDLAKTAPQETKADDIELIKKIIMSTNPAPNTPIKEADAKKMATEWVSSVQRFSFTAADLSSEINEAIREFEENEIKQSQDDLAKIQAYLADAQEGAFELIKEVSAELTQARQSGMDTGAAQKLFDDLSGLLFDTSQLNVTPSTIEGIEQHKNLLNKRMGDIIKKSTQLHLARPNVDKIIEPAKPELKNIESPVENISRLLVERGATAKQGRIAPKPAADQINALLRETLNALVPERIRPSKDIFDSHFDTCLESLIKLNLSIKDVKTLRVELNKPTKNRFFLGNLKKTKQPIELFLESIMKANIAEHKIIMNEGLKKLERSKEFSSKQLKLEELKAEATSFSHRIADGSGISPKIFNDIIDHFMKKVDDKTKDQSAAETLKILDGYIQALLHPQPSDFQDIVTELKFDMTNVPIFTKSLNSIINLAAETKILKELESAGEDLFNAGIKTLLSGELASENFKALTDALASSSTTDIPTILSTLANLINDAHLNPIQQEFTYFSNVLTEVYGLTYSTESELALQQAKDAARILLSEASALQQSVDEATYLTTPTFTKLDAAIRALTDHVATTPKLLPPANIDDMLANNITLDSLTEEITHAHQVLAQDMDKLRREIMVANHNDAIKSYTEKKGIASEVVAQAKKLVEVAEELKLDIEPLTTLISSFDAIKPLSKLTEDHLIEAHTDEAHSLIAQLTDITDKLKAGMLTLGGEINDKLTTLEMTQNRQQALDDHAIKLDELTAAKEEGQKILASAKGPINEARTLELHAEASSAQSLFEKLKESLDKEPTVINDTHDKAAIQKLTKDVNTLIQQISRNGSSLATNIDLLKGKIVAARAAMDTANAEARDKESKARSALIKQKDESVAIRNEANELIARADALKIQDGSLATVRSYHSALGLSLDSKTPDLAGGRANVFEIGQNTQRFYTLNARITSQNGTLTDNFPRLRKAISAAEENARAIADKASQDEKAAQMARADRERALSLHKAAVENLDQTSVSATSIADKINDALLSGAASFSIDTDVITKLKDDLLALISKGKTLPERTTRFDDDATSILGKVGTINSLTNEISSLATKLNELVENLTNEIARAAEDKAKQDAKRASTLREELTADVNEPAIISPSDITQAREKEAIAKSELDIEIGMIVTLLSATSRIEEAGRLGIQDPSLVLLRELTDTLATLHQSNTELAPENSIESAIIQRTKEFEALTAQIKSQKINVSEKIKDLEEVINAAKDKRKSALETHAKEMKTFGAALEAAVLVISSLDPLSSDPTGKPHPLKASQIKLQKLIDTSMLHLLPFEYDNPAVILEKAKRISEAAALIVAQTEVALKDTVTVTEEDTLYHALEEDDAKKDLSEAKISPSHPANLGSPSETPAPTLEIKRPEPSAPPLPDAADPTSHAFASLDDVKLFIVDARELLEDIKKRHRSHGHIEQYKSGYQQVSKITGSLRLAEQYLKIFDDADGTLKELQGNLAKLIDFADKLDRGIKKLQATIDTKSESAEGIIPSFGDTYRKIEVKPGEDFITIAKKSAGIPDPTLEPRSLLTLSAEAGEEFKHWTAISGDKTAYIHTLEGVGTYADGVDTNTDQYIAAVIQLEAALKVEGIFKLGFLPATTAFPEDRIEKFCEELARYLNKNRFHPDDPKGIAAFLKSPEYNNLAPTPPAFPKDIDLSLAELYQKTVTQDAYRDKTRALAASIVNRFLANKQDLTSEPLRITSAFSPEIAKEVMIICELRNSQDPDHKIDYRNNTVYEKIPRPTKHDVDALSERLKVLAQSKDEKNPLSRFLNKLVPHDEKPPTAEQVRHKVGRAAPDIGFFNQKVKKVDAGAKKIEQLLAKHNRKRE